MGILNKLSRIMSKPTKYIYRIFLTKTGKRKKRRLLRNANKSDKTYLQRQHFGTFSPIKRF